MRSVSSSRPPASGSRPRSLPIIADHFEAGTFPTELIPQMGELGLLGASMPKYGAGHAVLLLRADLPGAGARRLAACAASSRCRAACACSRSTAFGSEEQKERYLPKMARGELIGCFGLTEPDHGSDPGGMETRAVPDGDGWVLNGTKMWITNGSIADLCDGLGARRRTACAASWSTPTRRASAPARSRRSSRCGPRSPRELHFDDMRVPASAMLPGANGLGAAAALPERGALRHRLGRRSARRWPASRARWSYAKVRVAVRQADRRLPAHPGQARGHADRRSPRRQLLALQLGRLKDAGKLRPQQVSLAKRANVAMALEIARTAARDPRRQRHQPGAPDDSPHGEPGDRLSPTRAPTRSTRWCSART